MFDKIYRFKIQSMLTDLFNFFTNKSVMILTKNAYPLLVCDKIVIMNEG